MRPAIVGAVLALATLDGRVELDNNVGPDDRG